MKSLKHTAGDDPRSTGRAVPVPAHSMLGAAEGPAVFVLDGTRAGALGDEAHVAAVRAGVRLVVPRLPSELRSLADALCIRQLGILAQGVGVAAALDAIAVLGSRVRALSILGSAPAVPASSELPVSVWEAHPEIGPTLSLYDAALRFCAPA